MLPGKMEKFRDLEYPNGTPNSRVGWPTEWLCASLYFYKRLHMPAQTSGRIEEMLQIVQALQHTMTEIEANDKIVEPVTGPYGGLSPEDADFMRQYEGKAGKKVVRKVSLIQWRRLDTF